jgi:hypothetical protein
LAAARAGDLAALLTVLDPDVVLLADAASVPSGTPVTLRGATAVARGALAACGGPRPTCRPGEGDPGIVMAPLGQLMVAPALTIPDERISRIEVIADPDRLEHVELAVLDD